MKPSLAGVDLRLARADEHLALLYGQRTLLLHAKGNRVVGHFDADVGDYIFRVEGDPPPAAWGITLGELIHALRASLDNLAYELMLARGGSPDSRPDFAIYEYETDRKGNPNAAKIRLQMPGLTDEDYAFIEGCQPYQPRPYPAHAPVEPEMRVRGERIRAGWHELALLREFDDADKHRQLHASFAAQGVHIQDFVTGASTWGIVGGRTMWTATPGGGITGFAMPTSTDGSVTGQADWRFGINEDDPTEIARAIGITIREGSEPKMEMQPGIALDIALGYRERPLTVLDLLDIRNYVVGIVEHFRPVIG